MRRGFIPVRDAACAAWAAALAKNVTEAPSRFGLTSEEAEAFAAASAAFGLALRDNELSQRSRTTVARKDAARLLLEAEARKINDLVRGRGVADINSIGSLGLTLRKRKYRRVGRPTAQPRVTVKSVGAPIISLTISVHDDSRIALPDDVAGVAIYHWIGDDEVPDEPDDWKIVAQVSRCRVSLPIQTTPGTRVRFAAYYLNRRGERGPWGPVTTTHALGGFNNSHLAA